MNKKWILSDNERKAYISWLVERGGDALAKEAEEIDRAICDIVSRVTGMPGATLSHYSVFLEMTDPELAAEVRTLVYLRQTCERWDEYLDQAIQSYAMIASRFET